MPRRDSAVAVDSFSAVVEAEGTQRATSPISLGVFWRKLGLGAKFHTTVFDDEEGSAGAVQGAGQGVYP